MWLVSVDPGETTGYVVSEIPDESIGMVGLAGLPIVHYAGVFRKRTDLPRLTHSGVFTPDIVIIEQFRLFEDKALVQTGSTFPTVKIIGVLEFLIDLRNTELDENSRIITVLQEASCSTFWNLAKMKALGYDMNVLGIPSTDLRHVYSALSHLLFFVRFKLEKWLQLQEL